MFWDPLLKWAKKVWNAWDIQAIVLFSMTLQLILLTLGRLRSRITTPWVRFIVWASYLMAGWIATVGISKLSELTVENPYVPDTKTALGVLLVPLFLLHLGSPDTITAYSIEDNQLGIREIFGVIAQVGLVIWILFDCWTYTRLSFLTIPMFCVGLIKYAERAWSLRSALNEEVGVTTSKNEENESIPQLLEDLGERDLSWILRAYYRFDHLKPHLENWVYRPFYLSDDVSMYIDPKDPEKAFKITDIELGFMYDALYTKLPLIYSRVGFILRFLAFIGIVLTFRGFALLFKPSLHQRDVTFTYAVLLVAVFVELYSNARLLFTDWAIVWMTMTRFHKLRPLHELVQLLAKHSIKRNRWSNRLYQFNIVGFCLRTRHKSWMTKFLSLCHLDESWERYRFQGDQKEICNELKRLVLKKMEEIDHERQKKPFAKCGSWTIKSYTLNGNICETICTEFGRSIAIWHIATNFCFHKDDDHSPQSLVSKMLSDYMMHLLVNVPSMLSIPSGPIIFNYLREVLTELCKDLPSTAAQSSSSTDESSAYKHLFNDGEKEKWDRVIKRPGKYNVAVNELKWSILLEAHKLAKELSEDEREWEVILSVWVEMLCYAADNCTLYNHAEQLRRGGEFLTLIWLLISHNTDRYNAATCV